MMSAYAKRKITMEILNLAVGFELIVVGLWYFIQLDIPSAASWSIFGCMYLVMDKYGLIENMSKKRKLTEDIKYVAAWLGLVISTAFLGYLFLN